MVMFGKIVPSNGEAIDDGALYLRRPDISVRKRGDAAPAGFEARRVSRPGGVIYRACSICTSPCLQHPARSGSSKVFGNAMSG